MSLDKNMANSRQQNKRLRKWFKSRTGLQTELLSEHMAEIDRLIGYHKPAVEDIPAGWTERNSDDWRFYDVGIRAKSDLFAEAEYFKRHIDKFLSLKGGF